MTSSPTYGRSASGTTTEPVLLLVVLYDGEPGPAHRQAAAIQGVNELGFALGRFRLDRRPPRLEASKFEHEEISL